MEASTAESVYKKLNEIENEIIGLKLLIMQTYPKPKKLVSLKDSLKGVHISDSDIEKAKKSLFPVHKYECINI